MKRGIRMPKSLLPKPAKIAKRELYNAMWRSGNDDRRYEKRLKSGRI